MFWMLSFWVIDSQQLFAPEGDAKGTDANNSAFACKSISISSLTCSPCGGHRFSLNQMALPAWPHDESCERGCRRGCVGDSGDGVVGSPGRATRNYQM